MKHKHLMIYGLSLMALISLSSCGNTVFPSSSQGGNSPSSGSISDPSVDNPSIDTSTSVGPSTDTSDSNPSITDPSVSEPPVSEPSTPEPTLYTVTFRDYDNTLLDTEQCEYDEAVTYHGRVDLTRPSTQEFAYTFTNNWTTTKDGTVLANLNNITVDMVVYAEYTKTTNTYTITWNDYNNKELKHELYAYGATPDYGNIPTRASDGYKTYTFSKWSPDIAIVTDNQTYTAQYDSVDIVYTVTFYNWDSTYLGASTCGYNESVTYDGIPTRDSDADYNYIFKGWDLSLSNITSNCDRYAQYNAVSKSLLTVNFVNWDDSVLYSTSVNYGDTVEYKGDTPTKGSGEGLNYIFSSWDKPLTNITSNCTIKAQFEKYSSGLVYYPTDAFKFGEGYVVSGCSKDIINAVISSVYDDGENGRMNVIGIGYNSEYSDSRLTPFKDCTNLVSVSIPDTVKFVAQEAFSNCSSLQSITLPCGVICPSAFNGCTSLQTVSINGAIARIDEFQQTSFDDAAFLDCPSFTTLNLGKEVTSFVGSIFCGVKSLTSITIDSENEVYHSTNNCVIKTKEKVLVYGCGNLSVPSDGSVTSVDDFFGCASLISIVLPSSVAYINQKSFYGCSSLTSVVTGDGVTCIGGADSSSYGLGSFENCTSLTSITFGTKMEMIGFASFRGCTSLTSITIPDSVTKIYGKAFADCTNLKTVKIGSGLIKLIDHMDSMGDFLEGCEKVETITVSSQNTNLTSINNSVYQIIGSGLELVYCCPTITTLVLPSNTNYIFYYFTNAKSLTSVTLSSNLVSNISFTLNFANCPSLETLTIDPANVSFYSSGNCIINKSFKELVVGCKTSIIPNDANVTSIGRDAFYGCSSLTSITIPNNITSIGTNAFYDCTSLASISVSNNIESIGVDAFYNTAYYNDSTNWESNGLLYLSSTDSSTSYLINHEADITSCVIDDKATSIPDDFFANNKKLTSVSIPSSVTTIGYEAFLNCDNLASVTIESGVTSIGSYAFSKCNSLTSITIPSSVTYIGNSAFSACTSLKTIVIGENVTYIGSDAFYNTAYLNDSSNWDDDLLYLSTSDDSLSYLIKANTSITSCVIKSNTKLIGANAFCNCSSLTSVSIPSSVVYMCKGAFMNCNALTSIIIPSSVLYMGEGALNSTSLTIYCEATSRPAGWEYIWGNLYWYSEDKPTTTGSYWHYVDGVPTIWLD